MNNLSYVISKLRSNPYRMEMGAGKLSRWFKTDKATIYKAKAIIRGEKLPKILLLDIETAPTKAFVWQQSMWRANIHTEQIISEWFMLTWAAKWFGQENVMSNRITSQEVKNEDDSRIVKGIWELVDEADIVIAHNGKKFDIPNLNTRFLLAGLRPPKSYKQIDTKEVAAKEFGFTHNSLNGIARTLKLGSKLSTNFNLWVDCYSGNEQSLKYMEEYNKEDVRLLEDVYIELRPWIKSHPNCNMFVDSEVRVCPVCGSENLTQNGFYYTHTGKYPQHICDDCGAISRERKTVFDRKREILISIPGR